MDEMFTSTVAFLFMLILLMILISFIFIWLYVAKKQKLVQYVGEGERKKEKRTMKEKLLGPLIRASEYVGPTALKYPLFVNIENDEKQLIYAGQPMGMTLKTFYGLRYVLGFGSLIIFWAYHMLGMPFGFLLMVIMPVAGFVFPNIWIRLKAKDRQEIISATMPDFMDIVSISLRAGASLDGALRQVSERMDGPLSEEIGRFTRETSLGVPRKTAFQQLLDRNTSKELESLVTSLIQGEELGVPISQTFNVQAQDLRQTRGFKAKEKAAKASPQITLVTTFIVAPSVLLMIVGLMILNLIYNPGAFGLDIFFGS
ncbi:type II secretion system F family protein [Alteribacter aurantiacus]|uniref:type II secretion system F family protein n=1 Tax=Alteribacter aurantiacus TaxID=254410 RepID=UPI000402A3D7|nr:type II secretion system F family protein [Alteribacter aurantiacus]